jgi:YebC/PmpR family DNA-binding regulatory protein
MAGHSKWANIKHRKAAKDAKKGASFAQFSRELIMAAKIGGDNPDGNFRLRTAIDRAKAAGLPNNTIERAIAKGAGKLDDGDLSEDMTYEGYGPGGAAIFIEAVTDNKNRTAGDIRSYFNKNEGNLGSDGCVAWMFEATGLILASKPEATLETMLEAAIEAGAEDVQPVEDIPDDIETTDTVFELTTATDNLNSVCEGLTAQGITIHSAEITRTTENTTELTDASHVKYFTRLMDAIESHDDVQHVYTNATVDESLFDEADD